MVGGVQGGGLRRGRIPRGARGGGGLVPRAEGCPKSLRLWPDGSGGVRPAVGVLQRYVCRARAGTLLAGLNSLHEKHRHWLFPSSSSSRIYSSMQCRSVNRPAPSGRSADAPPPPSLGCPHAPPAALRSGCPEWEGDGGSGGW
eukprot:scaffold6263_cov99-Isochrysis_galbana.AAC.6